ncbi:MAG: pentapeptide repeat-containing protein [Sulfurimonas sp.]|nr:pentapeptide repeat-containing protein [Sulfurimonas sp.]
MKITRWDTRATIYEADCNLFNDLIKAAIKDKVDLYKADFRDVNFRDVNFSGTNFRDANFTNVNFINSNFSNANFINANFSDANFRDVNFTNTKFRGANLVGANFIDVTSVCTDFTDANLTNAHLAGANLAGADFTDANLTNAKGIDYFQKYNLCEYKSYIFVQTSNKPVARIGSFNETIRIWNENLHNNNGEFIGASCDESKDMLDCYKTMVEDYNAFKNEKLKSESF